MNGTTKKSYAGENGVSGSGKEIKRCSCWAHVRRCFTDAIPQGKEYDYSLPAMQGVQSCSKLFDCEWCSKAKNHTAEQRKQFRLEKEEPILDTFWNWLEQQRPNDKMSNEQLEQISPWRKTVKANC